MNFVAFPRVTTISERRVHARFSHKCGCCPAPIQRGEQHIYIVYTDNDTTGDHLRTVRLHISCPQV